MDSSKKKVRYIVQLFVNKDENESQTVENVNNT